MKPPDPNRLDEWKTAVQVEYPIRPATPEQIAKCLSGEWPDCVGRCDFPCFPPNRSVASGG